MAEKQYRARHRVHTAIYSLNALVVVVGFVAFAKNYRSDESTIWSGVWLVCLLALVVVMPALTWLVNRWWPDPAAVDGTKDRDIKSD